MSASAGKYSMPPVVAPGAPKATGLVKLRLYISDDEMKRIRNRVPAGGSVTALIRQVCEPAGDVLRPAVRQLPSPHGFRKQHSFWVTPTQKVTVAKLAQEFGISPSLYALHRLLAFPETKSGQAGTPKPTRILDLAGQSVARLEWVAGLLAALLDKFSAHLTPLELTEILAELQRIASAAEALAEGKDRPS